VLDHPVATVPSRRRLGLAAAPVVAARARRDLVLRRRRHDEFELLAGADGAVLGALGLACLVVSWRARLWPSRLGTFVVTAGVVGGWTAGVVTNPLVFELGLPLDERRRIRSARVPRPAASARPWALGDCARAERGDAGTVRPADVPARAAAGAAAREEPPRRPRPYR
jgi:hypothetical protein